MEHTKKSGRAAIFKGAGEPIEIKRFLLRSLQPGEILVENLYTTLCGSDIHTYCGIRKEPCPTVLGHEIVGRVVEIENTHMGLDYSGEVLYPGDIITWSIFASDPASHNASIGMPQKGDHLFKYGHTLIGDDDAFHGGLADYCVLRAHTALLKIPAYIPIPVAATLNCAIATVAGALRMAGGLKDKNVLIFGTGMLGICCSAMCKDAGAKWVGGIDLSSKRLNYSLSFGVDEIFVMEQNGYGDIINQIKSRLPKMDIDVVFDISGAPDAMEAGIELLTIGGQAIWIGAVFNNRKVNIDAENVIRKLITIKGLHNYNYEDFAYALDFLKANWNKYPFSSIIEKEFKLEDTDAAFEYAITHKPLRVGIRIDE